jgi:hypothetical protein
MLHRLMPGHSFQFFNLFVNACDLFTQSFPAENRESASWFFIEIVGFYSNTTKISKLKS